MVHEIWTLDIFVPLYLIYEEYVIMILMNISTFISYLCALEDEYWMFETSLHFFYID
jgi:hypothetical protein